jgi:hypothetical protein
MGWMDSKGRWKSFYSRGGREKNISP